MDLFVWRGDCGLPTAHPDNLALATYFKLAGIPVRISPKGCPFFYSAGRFPILKSPKGELADPEDVEKYLNSQGLDLDRHLEEGKRRGELFVDKQYVKNVLHPCFEYAWWVDEKNYDETIRSWFAKKITIPFNFYYPDKFRERATQLMYAVYGNEIEKAELYEKVYEGVDVCFKYFSDRLGHKDFIYGNKPTSLDALLFGYLAPILKVPLKNPTICNKLRNYDNLVRYVNNICKNYYEEYEKEHLNSLNNKNKDKKSTANDENYTQHTILAVVVASIAMLGFAHSNGLLN